MRLTLQDRLLQRELGDNTRFSGVRGIYGDRRWIDDLDIVNELGGHTGCVNALSWSKSGRLLASGSDDVHLNIHSYQPDSSTTPFALSTSISTGHRANIFSVKFMPHSDDRTLVTAAGDSEVRVFDIEYSGRSTIPSSASTAGNQRIISGYNKVYNGVRHLSDGDTNCRVFRSHSDRVKRIVTESSPFLFLTCSEDGEVRQWDIRQPSSAYPPARGYRSEHSQVPPPLISYKLYGLDLNTISCSPSQPHYIALGGAHLHCFLHDRRMTGRDLLAERGQPDSRASSASISGHEEELMGQATRCVRRFAPNGKQRMRRTDGGHITACKISDASPNELIASWSGDWIYSFDIAQSSDALDAKDEKSMAIKEKSNAKIRDSGERKRKRGKMGSSSSLEGDSRAGSKPRQDGPSSSNAGDLAIRVRYENGQSEEIPIESTGSAPRAPPIRMSGARLAMLDESQRMSHRISKGLVHLRKCIFSPSERASSSSGAAAPSTQLTPLGISESFDTALAHAAIYLPQMDEVMRSWRYPVDPDQDEVTFQRTLRRNRESARRFVQAAGTLARCLGGKLRTAGPGESPALQYFTQINPSPNEGSSIDEHSRFSYDFLKAVLLWLESGCSGLLQGFKRPADQRNDSPRFPIPENASLSAIHDILIPYLLRMATSRPIPNLDVSRFERDESRKLFQTETAAVLAFANVVRIPLEHLQGSPVSTSSEGGSSRVSGIGAQDRPTALRFWGFRVCRGLLMNAGEGINFAFVDRAFGGLGAQDPSEETERSQEDIDPDEDQPMVEHAEVVHITEAERPATSDLPPPYARLLSSADSEVAQSDEDVILMDEFHDVIADDDNDDDNDEDDEDDDDEGDDDDQSPTNTEDEDEDIQSARLMWTSAFEHGLNKQKVEVDVPCSSHTRVYRGHCNFKTVKDVNFYGLQDDYVVSGSDSGHVFIWERKTGQLVNILEGDGEVVNVVQGHPYEPMLAVSGIDHTIKIFSPDQRTQDDARNGINIANEGNNGFSSLEMRITRLGRARRPNARASRDGGEPGPNPPANGLSSRRRMQRSYEITSQNDVERRGAMRDNYITRDMIEQLAIALSERADGGDENAMHLVEGDGCQIM